MATPPRRTAADIVNPDAPPRAAVRDIRPAHAAVEHADRGTRLGAALLDAIVFMAIVYAPLIVAAIAIPALLQSGAIEGEEGETLAGTLVAVTLGATLIGLIVYLWLNLKQMAATGQSLGKKWLGIKVVRSDGSPCSLSRLIWLRNVVNWLVSIIPFYGIVDVLWIFGEERQCLHDKIADTIVVKA